MWNVNNRGDKRATVRFQVINRTITQSLNIKKKEKKEKKKKSATVLSI